MPNTDRPVCWITHPECRLHDMGAGHPESPRRLDAIEDRLRADGSGDFLQRLAAPMVSAIALERVHDAAHVERILTADTTAGEIQIDPDTLMNPHSLEAALRAAGAGVLAVDEVLAGRAGLAFCAVRPPGHHAERARAMGFCFFNNIAVAAAHALASGLQRVAILDFDVHYGNGTADIFKGDARVLVCQTYQHPLYPHWAGAPDAPNLVDVPLRAYSGSAAFRAAVTEHWLPRLESFQPELLLVSAGFDAHELDPMAELRFTTDDYRWIAGVIQGVAEACCEGRVVAMLEGGYHLDALARSVSAFLQPFLGKDLPG
ncbi:MAG: histone deacetylase family protein [Pseudomonadota bacterium]